MMMKEEVGGGGGWARACDTCQMAPCTVYCRADSAYLCNNCDARIHAANEVASRHERVWVCEACERAPAAFLCKADAASLCTRCDADIHSANPLARRHHRVPIMPVSGYLLPRAQVAPGLFLADPEEEEEDEEEEAASWLILNNPSKNTNTNTNNNNHINNGFLLEGEVDGYLDLFDYNCEQFTTNNNQKQKEDEEFSVPEKSCGGDSVVPVQSCCGEGKELQYQNFLFGMECDAKSGYNSYTTSFTHTVSVSSMDVGVVPESSMSDMSLSQQRPSKGTIDLFSGPPIQMPTQLSPMDREARVMRYREKKKTRKFEKTIRYASRKAYAETRPRIKGRFAKRMDVEAEMDQMFPNSLIGDGGYGIVPSF